MGTGSKYILNKDHSVTKVEDSLEWMRSFDESNRRVAANTVGYRWVSTVFLGLDHNFGDGPPILFESMMFPRHRGRGRRRETRDQIQVRYSTWDEAEKGHEGLVLFFKAVRALSKRYNKRKAQRRALTGRK